MRFFVGITDYDWYQLHASKPHVEEVNFWRPSPDATFRAILPGEPFLFKLHAPNNFIAGGGFFTKFLQLPVSLAWQAFGEGNGARTFMEFRDLLSRRPSFSPGEDPQIGCILLAEPFFFTEDEWIPAAPYFPAHTQVGRGYGMDEERGRMLWAAVSERLEQLTARIPDPGPAMVASAETGRYGNPILVSPRLGQGSFRVLVTDAYNRRCSMTGEKALPVLEAAHIKAYSRGGAHELSNGLCLRSDLHRLFDKGYVSVDPDRECVLVSHRLKDEFGNGEEYRKLQGKHIAIPSNPAAMPSKEHLLYHAQHVFR